MSWASIAGGKSDATKLATSRATASAGKALFKQGVSHAVPTHDELNDLNEGLAKLWELDVNCLLPGNGANSGDYDLDIQGRSCYSCTQDRAKRPLFKRVDHQALRQRPTFNAIVYLFDNYEREVGKVETVTAKERKEMSVFLDAILATPCMQYCHAYLVAHKRSSPSVAAFKKQLYQLWFEMYSSSGYYARKKIKDSSGFEHVFVGEEKEDYTTGKGAVVGCHNWLQLYNEERKGFLDYKGYISHYRARDRPDEYSHVLSLQFSWRDREDGSIDTKPMSTSFIGVSPEFEVALYTMVALLKGESSGHEKTVVEANLGGYDVKINCVMTEDGRNIRTCYPSA